MAQTFFVVNTDEASGTTNVAVFVGAEVRACDHTHPAFSQIIEYANSAFDGDVVDGDDVLGLFDVAEEVSKRFEPLSERVSVQNGAVYFDGDQVDDTITRQVVRFLEEGENDWLPLVAFMENVANNPQEQSREQLYDWLRDRNFTITDDGCFIAYKGLTEDYKSTRSGPGIVNGEEVNGYLDNSPGNSVEIARSLVHHDPNSSCASGLHVGTHAFAKSWSRGKFVEVKVNPRDVVSVPHDSSSQKIRVCRYLVLGDATNEIQSAFASYAPQYEEEDLDTECPCDW